jgi:hypothetical protein
MFLLSASATRVICSICDSQQLFIQDMIQGFRLLKKALLMNLERAYALQMRPMIQQHVSSNEKLQDSKAM